MGWGSLGCRTGIHVVIHVERHDCDQPDSPSKLGGPSAAAWDECSHDSQLTAGGAGLQKFGLGPGQLGSVEHHFRRENSGCDCRPAHFSSRGPAKVTSSAPDAQTSANPELPAVAGDAFGSGRLPGSSRSFQSACAVPNEAIPGPNGAGFSLVKQADQPTGRRRHRFRPLFTG